MTPLSTPAAQGTVAVRETAIAICERWLAAFADTEIEYTSARQYASDAVRDIIDQIRAIDVASPSPEALPASAVESLPVVATLYVARGGVTARAVSGLENGPDEYSELVRLADVRALTSAPAPEERT